MGAADDASRKNAPKTRGRPFEPGNGGRPKGSRNKTTLMVERMIEGEAEALTTAAIEMAKGGDPSLLRAMLDRLAPARKEPTVTIDLPPIQSPADAPAVAARLIEAAAAGEIAPGEAQGLAGLLESYRRQSELADIEARLRVLEENANAKR
jgi:hypothetical protein